MKKRYLLVGLLVGGFVCAEEKPIDYFAISLEELMQIPIVESASRQAEPWHLTSVPVSIITAEDIHYSGLTRLGEILQFAPGVDYVKLDNNYEMIGVRGLHASLADKTLLLIDGRPAENNVYGGFMLKSIPVLVEDIDRIEVVRGPASAAWGANAVNGVINIITKEPKDTLGFASSVTMDEEGNSYSFARWGEEDGNLSYRLSVGYSEGKASGGNEWDQPLIVPTEGRDFYRDSVFDSLFIYEPSDETKISFGLALSRREEGDFNFTGYQPMKDSEIDTARVFVRLEQEIDEIQSFSLQWAGRMEEADYPITMNYKTYENDFEVEYAREDENNKLTVGANVRLIRITAERADPVDYFDLSESPYDENWVGIYVIDRWQALNRLVIEGQLRGDSYNQTGKDWSGRLTGLWSLDDEDRHVVRLSVARAFRAPMAGYRNLEIRRTISPFPLFKSTDDMGNEHITSYELGYTALFSSNYTLRLNAYYQDYDDLIARMTVFPNGAVYQRQNGAKATAMGAEAEFEVKGESGLISLWAGYHDFKWRDMAANLDSVDTVKPARLKAGLTGRAYLPAESVLSLHYKYSGKSDHVFPGVSSSWPASHRLDLTLSKAFFDGKAELLVGVSDLLDDTGDPASNIYLHTPSHETAGAPFLSEWGYSSNEY